MKKQFDLQYYLEHPETKVVTRKGRSARIICTDLENKEYPIAAAFSEAGSGVEVVETYTSEGKYSSTSDHEHSIDLFFDLPDHEKKKAYLIRIKKVEVAEVYVLANSDEEAVAMVTEDTQCIEDYDYGTDGPEIYCEDEKELVELSPTRAIYDYDLNRTIVGEIQEGGEE